MTSVMRGLRKGRLRMNKFIYETLIFIGLWIIFFIYEGSLQSVPILLVSVVVGIMYFFYNVSPNPFILFYTNMILLLVLYYFSMNPYSLVLLTFFVILAVEKLKRTEFILLSLLSFVILTLFLVFGKVNGALLLFFIALLYIALRMNMLITGVTTQRNMYEALLGEYRKFKRLAAISEEEARYEERAKIARDIHDSVGHKLTSLLMQLEILSIQKGEEDFKELKILARESLEETRFAVRALKATEQEGMATILQLIKKLESESHILVQLTTKKGVLSVRLTNEQSVALYRVIQEGLTNAMRHANSREVFIELGRTAIGDIEFSIKNKIYKEEPIQEGFGLQNMRKRIEEQGGLLSVYQANDEFVVKGMIPIKETGSPIKNRVESEA